MIGTIRAMMQTGGAKAILWLTLLSLAGGTFISIFRYSKRSSADSIGVVNGIDIGLMEFRRTFEATRAQIQKIRKESGPHADLVLQMWGLDKNPYDAVIEGLIAEKVIQSAADSLGAEVSKEYLNAKLRDQFFAREFLSELVPPQAYIQGGLDVTILKYYLQRQGIAEDDFEEMVHNAMKRVLLQRLVEGSLYIPRAALKQAYERQYLKKKYGILTLSFDEYLQKARSAKLSNKAVAAYFDAHKEHYRIPEKRSARVWTFDPTSYGIIIADKDVVSEYHKRKRGFVEKSEEIEVQRIVLPFDAKNKNEVRGRAQELYKQVKAKPETFESVGKKHSQAKEKGAKVTVKRGEKSALFEHMTFELGSKEIAPVFETSEGFEIVKLINKRKPVYKSLEKMRDTLLETLKAEKFASDFATNAQRIISQASDMPELFAKFIAAKKGQVSRIEHATPTETIKSEKLFGLRKVGDRTFFQDGKNGYIIELSVLTPSTLPALNKLKEKVLNDMYNDRARLALKTDLASARSKIKDGKETLGQVAKKLKGLVETSDWMDPQDKETLKKLQEKGIRLGALLQLTKPHTAVIEVTPKSGYLIELSEIKPFDEKAFNAHKAKLEAQLRKQELQAIVPAFGQALRSRAKVVMNKELVRHATRGY